MELFASTSGRSAAFLVGNGQYAHAPPLSKARNDVRRVKESLERVKFSVSDYCDLSGLELERRFEEFADRLTAADTVLLYYSGHGIQIDGANYIVPPEADLDDPGFVDSLVSIQSMVSRLSNRVSTTLVFLDACRSNPFSPGLSERREQDAHAKGLQAPPAVPVGLAAFHDDADMGGGPVFVAFAAAPGKTAFEGKGEVSIFTEGMVSAIETADLPIYNLMIRITRYVKDKTEGRQQPWSLSSLPDAFFFSRSSLVWFNANLIGFAAMMVAIGVHSLVMRDAPSKSPALVALSFVCLITTIILFLLGIGRSYRYIRGDTDAANGRVWLQSLVGGFFGGIFAGPAIGLPYWWDWRNSLQPGSFRSVEGLGVVLGQITVAAVVVALLLGALSYGIAQWAGSWGRTPASRSALTVLGGVVGGLLAGIALGLPVTSYFGALARPFVTPITLLPGSLVGTAAIVFAIISYRVDRFNYRQMMWNAAASFGGVVVSGGLAAVIAVVLWLKTRLFMWMAIGIMTDSIVSGTVIGVSLGVVLGAAIGLAAAFSASPTTASAEPIPDHPLDRSA